MKNLLTALFLLTATPALACLASSFPEHGSEVHINDHRVELEFEDVVDLKDVSATVIDELGRQVSTGELRRGDDNKTVFVMLRPQGNGKTGYESVKYFVEWKLVQGEVEHSGKFTFRVHKH